MKCQACERPESLCECYEDMEATKIHAKGYLKEGGVKPIPAVEVVYGSVRAVNAATGEPTDIVFNGGADYSVFPTDEEAEDFAEFLSSDAIFDCVIPSRFLKCDLDQEEVDL